MSVFSRLAIMNGSDDNTDTAEVIPGGLKSVRQTKTS